MVQAEAETGHGPTLGRQASHTHPAPDVMVQRQLFVSQLSELACALGLPPAFHVVGNSLGGGVALAMVSTDSAAPASSPEAGKGGPGGELSWDSHSYIDSAPDTRGKGVEGNESMRRKFEAMCRAAQDKICDAISELDGLPTVSIPGSTQNMSNYFAVFENNGNHADPSGTMRLRATAAYDCINATGWRACTHLAELWLDQPLA